MRDRIKKLPAIGTDVKQPNRITISNIAELAGVSKATASLVLNGKGDEYRVSEDTQQRILASAEEHRYQPSFHARALRSSRSHTIGLVIPFLTQFTNASLAKELESLFRNAGIQIIIACSDEDPEQERVVVNNLLQRQIDGLIVISSNTSDEAYSKIHSYVPVVQLGRQIGDSILPLIMTDATTATADLIQVIAAQYPEEIYYFGGEPSLTPSRQRLEGYLLGLQRAKVIGRPEWIRQRNYRSYSGYDMMEELCNELGRPPKALFTASFSLLEGVMQYLNQTPCMQKDLHLASFDDHELLDFMPLHIDSISQDYTALAFNAFSALMALMEDKPLTTEIMKNIPARIRWRHPESRRLYKMITANQAVKE
jgi:LacI family transcriptional regulator, sucrose operon repressor